MQSRFTLTIHLGNDAMRTADDIAGALHATADAIANRYDGLTPPDDTAPIRDANGSKVGAWQIAGTDDTKGADL